MFGSFLPSIPPPSPPRRPPRSPPWSRIPAVPLPSTEECGPAHCKTTWRGTSNQRGTHEVGSPAGESRERAGSFSLLPPSSPLFTSNARVTTFRADKVGHTATRTGEGRDGKPHDHRAGPRTTRVATGRAKRPRDGPSNDTAGSMTTRGAQQRYEQPKHGTVGRTTTGTAQARHAGSRTTRTAQ